MNLIEDRTEDFRKFLLDISNAMPENDIIETLELVHRIYDNGWRHSYSLATQQLQKLKFENCNDVLGQQIENIQGLISKLEDEIIVYQSDDEKTDPKAISLKRCHRSLEKLFDHINLELIRLDKISELDDKIDNFSNKQKEIDYCSTRITNIGKQASKLELDYKNQRTEAITILGIFTAIIGVIGVGATLSSSIFSNMNEISSWKLYSLTCLIILFVSNILYALFDFLREIADKQKSKHEYLWVSNILLALFSIICFLVSFSDQPPQSSSKPQSSVCHIINSIDSISKP